MYVIIGGVGFDINCGVRLLRTNLFEKDVAPIKEQLAQVWRDAMDCVLVTVSFFVVQSPSLQG